MHRQVTDTHAGQIEGWEYLIALRILTTKTDHLFGGNWCEAGQHWPGNQLCLVEVGDEVRGGNGVQYFHRFQRFSYFWLQTGDDESPGPQISGDVDELADDHCGGIVYVFGSGQIEYGNVILADILPDDADDLPGGRY